MSAQKALVLETAPNTALIQIRWEGGGQVPQELSGLFTSKTEAQRAIELWESSHREVAVVDAMLTTVAEEIQKRGPGRPPKSV